MGQVVNRERDLAGEVVAAAIEGNYVSFHVLVHGSVVPVEVKQPVFQSQEKV